jgi:hypothetical protein
MKRQFPRIPVATKRLQSQLLRAREGHYKTAIDFIQTELNLIKTFCWVASTATDVERFDRNLEYARTAFNCASEVLSRLTAAFGTDDQSRFSAALDEASSNLERTAEFRATFSDSDTGGRHLVQHPFN